MTKSECRSSKEFPKSSAATSSLIPRHLSFVLRQQFFPPPNEVAFRVGSLRQLVEPAFFQHPGGRVCFGQSVSTDFCHVAVLARKLNQTLRNFGRVTFPLMNCNNAVPDLDTAVLIGRPGKPA